MAAHWLTLIKLLLAQLLSAQASRLDELRDKQPRLSPTELMQLIVANNPSDKFSSYHRYTSLYGRHLVSYIMNAHSKGKNVKLFEIGLGCDMRYFQGMGASYQVWRDLLRTEKGGGDEIWGADNNASCAAAALNSGSDAVHVVVGDQANITTLQQWVQQTGSDHKRGRPFDVIIDDGGHGNHQIFHSLQHLFSTALAPGGLYFIEDLHVGRLDDWSDPTGRNIIMIDVIKDWIEQLVLGKALIRGQKFKWPLLAGLKGIECVHHACVLLK